MWHVKLRFRCASTLGEHELKCRYRGNFDLVVAVTYKHVTQTCYCYLDTNRMDAREKKIQLDLSTETEPLSRNIY